jgi:hypothetical protein
MSDEERHSAPTLFLLMRSITGKPRRHWIRCAVTSSDTSVEKLLCKALRGDIALPIVRVETSQKAQRGVHLVDLAAYIDKRRAAAVKECHQLTGPSDRPAPPATQ